MTFSGPNNILRLYLMCWLLYKTNKLLHRKICSPDTSIPWSFLTAESDWASSRCSAPFLHDTVSVSTIILASLSSVVPSTNRFLFPAGWDILTLSVEWCKKADLRHLMLAKCGFLFESSMIRIVQFWWRRPIFAHLWHFSLLPFKLHSCKKCPVLPQLQHFIRSSLCYTSSTMFDQTSKWFSLFHDEGR